MNMHNSERKRPLCELAAWVVPLLELDEVCENNRKEFIRIAAEESPNKTFSLVVNLAINYGFGHPLANKIARAARWLAVIRRDYGQEEFNRLTGSKR